MDDRENLKCFAEVCINACFEGLSMEAEDIQDIAEKSGLLVKKDMVVPCGKNCRCSEYFDKGETVCCYRKSY